MPWVGARRDHPPHTPDTAPLRTAAAVYAALEMAAWPRDPACKPANVSRTPSRSALRSRVPPQTLRACCPALGGQAGEGHGRGFCLCLSYPIKRVQALPGLQGCGECEEPVTAQEGPRWGCMLPGMEAAGGQAGHTWAGAEAAAALVVDHGHALDAEAALAIPGAGVEQWGAPGGQPPIIRHALALHGMSAPFSTVLPLQAFWADVQDSLGALLCMRMPARLLPHLYSLYGSSI